MRVYSTPGPDVEPHLTLQPWLVLQCQNGVRYLIGWCLERFAARATTPIESFDRATMTVRTKSGRLYTLQGEPALDADAWYVWQALSRAGDFGDVVDVTADYFPGWQGAAGKVVSAGADAVVQALKDAGEPGWKSSPENTAGITPPPTAPSALQKRKPW